MATAGDSVEGNVDPYAECRIGRNLYLVVWEKSRYTVSTEPKIVAKGVLVKPRPIIKKGLRQFEVHREKITDTYDIVTVGTICVENGYAYVAGDYIPGEEPHYSYEIALIPPLKILYPYETPPSTAMDLCKVRSYLIKIIRKHNPRKLHVADNFQFCWDYDIDQPNTCGKCKVLKFNGGSNLCDTCVSLPAPAMATAVESVEGFDASEAQCVVDDYPHAADCRFGSDLYLVVWEFGVYDTSSKPKEIPEGVAVKAIPANACEKGLRQFEVSIDGEDKFDLVTVGTFMIDNGYAYVAGTYISGEKPHRSNEVVLIPPFNLRFPLTKLGQITRQEFREALTRSESDLVEIIMEYNPEKFCARYVRFGRPYHIKQKNLCRCCKAEMFEGGGNICDVCDGVFNDSRGTNTMQ